MTRLGSKYGRCRWSVVTSISCSLRFPLKPPSLHQHQLTGRRWLGQWRHYYPLLHCIFPPADLFYHSLPFYFYSGYCWPVSGCRYLGFTSPHDRHELFTTSTYVHRYPAHAANSILIHSQKQFSASQLSDNTDKAWGGRLPSSGYLRPIRGALESEQWSANLLFLATLDGDPILGP